SLRQKRVVAGVMLRLAPGAVVGSVRWTHSRPAQADSSTVTSSGFLTFLDTLDHTSFTAQTSLSSSSAGIFGFGTPCAALYRGGVAGDLTVNAGGILNPHYDGNGRVFSAPAADGSVILSTAAVHLNAVLNTAQHQATAEIAEDTTNQQHFVMVSQAPPSASAVVHATIQAITSQDWATLYGRCASELLGGMTEAQFAQLMTQQTQSLGSVVAVVVNCGPVVSYSDAGLTTFSVGGEVTISVNGTTQTTSSTAYYILEDGAWKLITTTRA
ncbi:MAG TPA: hypothetical protein VGS80_19425, partial [Ktedonobacterales bacterium]|nr:hypothetical protein [Ktedonobacterales bacterium]